jgi:ribosome-interacting GTPase 1
MPANLPPDYHKAEAKFRAARETAEKIAALEEMLRIMPKHKGTDHLQADLRARIAKLRKQPAKKGSRSTFTHYIPREGAGQIALVGPPNTGKSSLVSALTHASPEVADYPFTTREATPGMMKFEDISFQLIDLPPLSREHMDAWVFDLVRCSDLLWLVMDGLDPLGEMDAVQEILGERGIVAAPAGPGVGAAGEGPSGMRAASPPSPAFLEGRTFKKALLIATGTDRPGATGEIEALDELLEHRWTVVPVSIVTGAGVEALKRRTFQAMEIVRVYTKQPGKPADRRAPYTLPRGAKVGDLAERIHRDLLSTMKFARIWGAGTFDGQTVQKEHLLLEGDVVEIHA